MSKSGFVKGMVAGAVIGSVAALIFDPITPKQRKRAHRHTSSMFRNVGCMVDDLVNKRH